MRKFERTDHPEAAVGDGGVFEGDPQAEEAVRIGIEKGRILVAGHLTANFRFRIGPLADGGGSGRVSAVGRVGPGV